MVLYRVEWFISGVLNRRDFETYRLGFEWYHEVILLDPDATFEKVESMI